MTFSRTIDEDVAGAGAQSRSRCRRNITLQVEAVRPDGSRAPMIRLNTRARLGSPLLVRAAR